MVNEPNVESQQQRHPRSASSSPANAPKAAVGGGGGDQRRYSGSPTLSSQSVGSSPRTSPRGTTSRRGRGVRSRSPVHHAAPVNIVVGGEQQQQQQGGGGGTTSPIPPSQTPPVSDSPPPPPEQQRAHRGRQQQQQQQQHSHQPQPVRVDHPPHHNHHPDGPASPIRGPSSAAAAAAAAAKAFRSGQRGDGSRMFWRERGAHHHEGGRQHQHPPSSYGGRYGGGEERGGGHEQQRYASSGHEHDRGGGGRYAYDEPRGSGGGGRGRGGWPEDHHGDGGGGGRRHQEQQRAWYGQHPDERDAGGYTNGDRPYGGGAERGGPSSSSSSSYDDRPSGVAGGGTYRREGGGDPYRRGGGGYDDGHRYDGGGGGGYNAADEWHARQEGRETPRRSGGGGQQQQQQQQQQHKSPYGGGGYDDRGVGGGYRGDGSEGGGGGRAFRYGESATAEGGGGEGEGRDGGGGEPGVDDADGHNKQRVVMGGPSPIHVPRGTSTTTSSPPSHAQAQAQAEAQAPTPTHSHNTRHSSRRRQARASGGGGGGGGGAAAASSNASSVFRGRPGSSPVGGATAPEDDDDEDSPHQILLSLRTPSHSFEENPAAAASNAKQQQAKRQGGATRRGKKQQRQRQNQAPPSPEEPPRIQHSHHQRRTSDPLFFEPTRSPKPGSEPKPSDSTPPTIQGPPIDSAPSFTLFNQSFDSLGAGEGSLNLTMSGIDPSLSFGFGPVPSSKSKDEGGNFGAGGNAGGVVVRAGSYLTGNGEPNNSLRLSGSMGLGLSSSFGVGPDSQRQHYLGASPSGGGGSGAGGGNTMVLGVSPSDSFGAAVVRSSGARVGGPTIVLGGTPSPGSGGSSPQDDRGARPPPAPSGVIVPSLSSSFERDHHQQQRGYSRSSSRSLDQVRPSGPHHPGAPPGSPPTHFYDILKKHKMAFEGWLFLLPGLKVELEAVAASKAKAAASSPPKSTSSSSPNSSPSRSSGAEIKSEGKLTSASPSPAEGGKSPDRGAGGVGADSAEDASEPSNTPTSRTEKSSEPTAPSDVEVAQRRAKSALCAFGGSGYFVDQPTNVEDNEAKADESPAGSKKKKSGSIFRVKKETDIPDKARNAAETTGTKSKARRQYDEKLPNRYYENENRLSWEIEEDPPIEAVTDDECDVTGHETGLNSNNKRPAPHVNGNGVQTDRHGKKTKMPPKKGEGISASDRAPSNYDGAAKKESQATCSSPQPKMRYRCKLCGQPKQNHNCTYQQSLQRSIGTMVYPAVNAFTAIEPGVLAPPLSVMNNFVPSSGSEPSSTATTPSRSGVVVVQPSPATALGGGSPHNVTPDTLRSSVVQHHINSPGGSSLSTNESPPRRSPHARGGRIPGSSSRRRGEATPAGYQRHPGGAYPVKGPRRKRYLPQVETPGSISSVSSDLLFVDATDLRPEQFRIVSASVLGENSKTRDGSYDYPSLPLPYAQRKRLSDNLFALSKEVPHLTDECALVLREAREKDMWDRAVSELMTQVLVVVHCPEEDTRLEGIRQYLLTLGIAC